MMNETATDEVLSVSLSVSPLGKGILRTLAYSEVFSYPLTAEEILQGIEYKAHDLIEVQNELDQLIQSGLIYNYGSHYSLSSDSACLNKRLERNARAQRYLPWAYRISRFIGSFPFVRGVFLSGSISKNSMDEDSDIDYFIITEPGRLWVSRTLLIAFKKLFLFNSYKFFCLNYFLDKENLTIKDHNTYVAHEIISLIPTYGRDACEEFHRHNQWVHDLLPNERLRHRDSIPGKNGWIKRTLEFLLRGSFGDLLERKFLSISKNYWKKKFQRLNTEQYKDVSVSKENVSKHHPDNFKKIILRRQEVILKELGQQFDLNLA